MLAESAWLVAGLLSCLAGAEALVRGAVDLSARLRVPPLVAGLTVVAWGTSAPELAVSLRAGLDGEADLALGNAVGSNILNIAVILGLGALVQPLRVTVQVLRFDAPILVAVSAVLLLMLADGVLSRPEGGLLLSGLMAYTGLTIWMQRRASAADRQAFGPVTDVRRGSAFVAPVLIAVGLAALALGAGWMLDGATSLARRFGVGESIIGLTLVAAGTSLPELVTTIVAARRGEADIAIGNVVGSNIFNILGVLGLASAVTSLSLGGLGPGDLGAMLALAVVMVPFLWSRLTLQRWEGAVLLAGYAGYLAWRWP